MEYKVLLVSVVLGLGKGTPQPLTKELSWKSWKTLGRWLSSHFYVVAQTVTTEVTPLSIYSGLILMETTQVFYWGLCVCVIAPLRYLLASVQERIYNVLLRQWCWRPKARAVWHCKERKTGPCHTLCLVSSHLEVWYFWLYLKGTCEWRRSFVCTVLVHVLHLLGLRTPHD